MKAKTTLSVVVPVFNEEVDVSHNIARLYSFLADNFKHYTWQIVIADNGPSRDRTQQISRDLAQKYQQVKYFQINRPGRGGALKKVWLKDNSSFLAYMDVDLSSDLAFFPKLIRALEAGADLAIGSRLSVGSKVYGRTLTRELMSRGYNLLVKLLFWTSFSDAQCGFKAIKKEAARALLPQVLDTAWFFDSELLIIAQKAGFKVTEVPIVWRDDPRSTVKVAKTAWGDIKGLIRLFFTRPWRGLKK